MAAEREIRAWVSSPQNSQHFTLQGVDGDQAVMAIGGKSFTITLPSSYPSEEPFFVWNSGGVNEALVDRLTSFCEGRARTIQDLLNYANRQWAEINPASRRRDDDDDGSDDDDDDEGSEDAASADPEEDNYPDTETIVRQPREPVDPDPEVSLPTEATPTATRALMNNLKMIRRMDTRKDGFECTLYNNNLYKWHVTMFGYDATDDIQKDLEHTHDKHILVEMTFPPNYPFAPPFVRVIRPQFVFRTGHVTMGGAICHELLTPKGWNPVNTIEFLIIQIRAAFVTGGGRIDLSLHGDYSESEARAAYERLRITHGW